MYQRITGMLSGSTCHCTDENNKIIFYCPHRQSRGVIAPAWLIHSFPVYQG